MARANPARPPTRRMDADAPLPAVPTYAPAGAWEEPVSPRRKLWVAAIIALFVLAIMLFAIDPPFSAPPPTPANTTPVPPSTTTFTTTPSSTTPQPPPPPLAPPGPQGKKHKGGGDGGEGD